MTIIYCEPKSAFFSFDRNKMPSPLSLEKACRRHKYRQAYEAVVCEDHDPRHVVSVANDCVSVFFMDRKLRCYLEYNFQEKQPDKLFLTHALFREFDEDSAKPLAIRIFAFKEDGHILMEDRNLVNDVIQQRKAIFSVEENWENYPAFGDYASLCREDRPKPS